MNLDVQNAARRTKEGIQKDNCIGIKTFTEISCEEKVEKHCGSNRKGRHFREELRVKQNLEPEKYKSSTRYISVERLLVSIYNHQTDRFT